MRFPAKKNSLEFPVVSYLLTELFYIGMPVVRTDGRSGHEITKISRMDGLTNLLRYWAPLTRAWSSAIKKI